MPGSSLWLLPPDAHPLNDVLTSLIKRTATRYGSSDLFIPHVTLTSNILPSTYEAEPQKWLDSLDLPAGNEVQVEFEKLSSEDVYFRKLYIKCQKTAGLRALAKACREQAVDHGDKETARRWADEVYNPHTSLL
ncbi:2',3'-cyclic-nucleotide 3'-phosphodiesterase [Ascochyta rabiei]|uniref:2',3'-cyclic-nucleotide 3'-phosphodiesterase n=2 Tax=Didymella rabiei TaxID=5454 RepID=A0A163BEU8_DIDRA|nr:2',3'-cyclic-nucleotide 3'-phosphodiesterase [Ascochyta rabiei]